MTRFGSLRVAIDQIAIALDDRTPRERVLLGVMAVAATLAVVYLLCWQPLQLARSTYAAALTRQDALLGRIAAISTGTTAQIVTDPRPPAVIVSESAAAAGLAIRRLEPAGDRVRLVLEDADFNLVLAWVDTLDRDFGLRVAEIDISRRPEPGMVSATLMLRR
jgi:general secretion pathway protein M